MTTLNLEKELSEILEKMREIDISLQESHDLYFKAKEKYLTAEKEQKTKKEVSEIMLRILFMAGGISVEFIEDWQNGKITPTNKELELIKEGCKEVLEAFDNHFKEELLAYQGKPYDIHHQETKQKIRKIKNLILQEEIKNRSN